MTSEIRFSTTTFSWNTTGQGWDDQDRWIPTTSRRASFFCSRFRTQDVSTLFKHCTNIEHFDFGNSPYVDTSTVKEIADHYPRLQSIDLSYTKVDDEGVMYMATKCRHLETVKLWATPVTDSSVWSLTNGCPRLRELDIRDTTISPDWAKKIPELRLLF